MGDNKEYQLVGFIPGETNTLSITNGNITFETEITTPEIEDDFDIQVEKTDGDSNNELADGLYTVLGHDKY